MPTILRWNGYRFYFFSNERDEPPHVIVDKAGRSAKFWLNPVRLATNHGFRSSELNEIRVKASEHEANFLRVWYEHVDRNR
jgi:hypothetical protein